MDGIGLFLDQAIDALLLLLVNPVPVSPQSPLGGLRGGLAILKALLDPILLIEGERRLNLVHYSLVLSHYF